MQDQINRTVMQQALIFSILAGIVLGLLMTGAAFTVRSRLGDNAQSPTAIAESDRSQNITIATGAPTEASNIVFPTSIVTRTPRPTTAPATDVPTVAFATREPATNTPTVTVTATEATSSNETEGNNSARPSDDAAQGDGPTLTPTETPIPLISVTPILFTTPDVVTATESITTSESVTTTATVTPTVIEFAASDTPTPAATATESAEPTATSEAETPTSTPTPAATSTPRPTATSTPVESQVTRELKIGQLDEADLLLVLQDTADQNGLPMGDNPVLTIADGRVTIEGESTFFGQGLSNVLEFEPLAQDGLLAVTIIRAESNGDDLAPNLGAGIAAGIESAIQNRLDYQSVLSVAANNGRLTVQYR